MAYNETNVMANFNEFEENGQYGRYSDVQYDEMMDISEQEYAAHGGGRTPTTPQGSKIPVRRSSGIPLPTRKTTPVATQEKPAAQPQANERRMKTQPQRHHQKGNGGGSRGPPRVRSPEVRDDPVMSPESASDAGSEEVQLSPRTANAAQGDRVINQAVLEKLAALEERLEIVASESGLSVLDTTERLTVIQERMNRLEDQNFKILEEVTKDESPSQEDGAQEKEAEEAVKGREEILEKLTLLEDKFEEATSKNRDASQSIQTTTEKVLEEFAGKTSILQDSMAELEGKLTMNIKREIENMTKSLSQTGDKTKDLEVENAALKAQVAKLEDASKAAKESDQRIRSLEEENARLKRDNSAKQQNVAKTAADKDERIRKLESEKSSLQRDVGKLQIATKSLSEKEDKIKQLESEAAKLKTDSAQIQKLTTSVNQKDAKISELLNEVGKLKSKLSEAESKRAAQEEELQKATEQLNAIQAESEEAASGKKSKKGGKFKLF